jgi:molybdopterin converting factor small subunit
MSITVRLHPVLQHLAGGQKVVEVTGRTIGECLENLESRFAGIREIIRDKKGQLRAYYEILVNSESTYSKGLTTPVKEGDQIDVLFIVNGG